MFWMAGVRIYTMYRQGEYGFNYVRQGQFGFIGKNRIEDSRFFQILKKRAFPFFSTGHFEEVEAIWELNETTNETYRAKKLASPGYPQKISMIYLLRFRRYMLWNK